MKKKNIIIVVVISLVLVFHTPIYIGLWFGAAYIEKWITDYEVTKIERESRKENREAAEEWIKMTYGEEISKVISIEYVGRGQGWSTWSHFSMEAPFADGYIMVNSKNQSIEYGGFDLKGSKFQHLYSEWVKKQVGIEDENVELEFAGNYDKPYIEFDKITSLSEDYSEVFDNVKNYKLKYVFVKRYNNLNLENFIVYIKKFIGSYYNEMTKISNVENYNDFSISLFAYDFDFNVPNSWEFDKYYGTKDAINNYTANIINGEITNSVFYSYRTETNDIDVEEIIIS